MRCGVHSQVHDDLSCLAWLDTFTSGRRTNRFGSSRCGNGNIPCRTSGGESVAGRALPATTRRRITQPHSQQFSCPTSACSGESLPAPHKGNRNRAPRWEGNAVRIPPAPRGPVARATIERLVHCEPRAGRNRSEMRRPPDKLAGRCGAEIGSIALGRVQGQTMQEQHTARLDFNFNGFRFVDVRHGAAEIAIDVVRPESAAMSRGSRGDSRSHALRRQGRSVQ